MSAEPISFYADGLRLDGELTLPAGERPVGGWPAVVACSGFQGLKDIHPARFGRVLSESGYAVLGFDYRGFGRSDGPRGRLVPQEQVRDVRAALSLLEGRSEIDADRLGLVGWALGGAVAIAAAAEDHRVRAVAALNAIGDGTRSTRAMHDDATFDRLLSAIAEDRVRRADTGGSALVHPFSIVRLDDVTRGYVDDQLYPVPGFGSPVTLESAERLLEFSPEAVVDRIAPRPLLLVHGRDNALHRYEEAERLYARARDPKRLVALERAGHTEWMFDEHPTFRRMMDEVVALLETGLATPAARPAP